MQFYISVLVIFVLRSEFQEVHALPLNETRTDQVQDEDQSLAEDYANMKHDLIHNFGYSKEFTDLVEINLKRAVREEKERQRKQGIISGQKPNQQRQENPNQVSEEDYDEETTPAGPTTPGASPGDVVRGVAGIITSLGTFSVGNFWMSFVNFFPPNQREGAQALVDASQGRRPAKWPTIPTTTTKMTTTTKDEDEIDSEETTKAPAVTAAPAATATTQAPAMAGSAAAPPAPVVVDAAVTQAPAAAASVPATEAATRAPTTKYTVRRRPDIDSVGALRIAEDAVSPSSLANAPVA